MILLIDKSISFGEIARRCSRIVCESLNSMYHDEAALIFKEIVTFCHYTFIFVRVLPA